MSATEINQTFQSIRINDIGKAPLSLRDGQVVTGRVMKFFPDQKAAVRVGGQQLVAQLTTNLQANQNYLMQVNQTTPYIQLQVVSNEAIQTPNDAAQALLKVTQLQASRAEQNVLANLMKEQLPVSKENVSNVLQLARGNPNTQQQSILGEMLARNLPLNQSVYDALHQRLERPQQFQQSLQQISQQLSAIQRPTPEQIQLSQYLSTLTASGNSERQAMHHFSFQVLQEIGKGTQTTFQLLQRAGVVNQNVSFQQWSNEWTNWARNNQVQFTPGNNQSSPSNLPFNISTSQLQTGISQLQAQQLNVNNRQLNVLQSFVNQLNQTSQQSANPTNHKANFMQNTTQTAAFQQLVQTLSSGDQQTMSRVASTMQNGQWSDVTTLLNSDSGRQLQQALSQVLQNQTGGQDQRAMQFWSQLFSQMNPGSASQVQSLVQQMQGFMNMSQFDALESNLVRNQMPDYPNIQTLLQAVSSQSNSSTLQDAIQQMNQIFQATHLSTQDSAREWMQFSAQMPKEMFGLNEDLFMDFEGEKMKDGTINPKHCRVMFYLDLPQLQETVVDMQVNRGEVSLSIYHENPKLVAQISNQLEGTLKSNLEAKDYDLVSFDVKSLHEQKNHSVNPAAFQNPSVPTSKGVDYRA
ncbi:hypothetical protein [Halalkalibacillus halophilus]|uniref:hypothetical protein n=1 Tax=Halalkalibacillus halophilus TaxID=392827 RepID=UPI0003FB82B6|nr:hypothetical protein [Halalkalibacillus halophilus]